MEWRTVEGRPDYAALIELVRAEWPPEWGAKIDAELAAEMAASHDDDLDVTRLLIDAGETIGFYRYTRHPRDDSASTTAHTLDIALLPDRQGRGLGTMMMKDMMSHCRKRGYRKLLSRTLRSNAASIALHRSLGFALHMETDDSLVWEMDLD